MPASRPRPPAPPAAADPLRTLLCALAEETAELVTAADGLQGLVGELMAGPPLSRSVAMERAQALDALVQQLQGMEAFLLRLGAAPLEDLAVDTARAARALSLSTQCRRFDTTTPAIEAGVQVGECDLF